MTVLETGERVMKKLGGAITALKVLPAAAVKPGFRVIDVPAW